MLSAISRGAARRGMGVFSVSMLAIALAGCGGGDSGDTTVANSAPSFSSAATASIAENTTAAYKASASDAQGDPITYSIAGGADAAAFSIDASGALTFVTAPNYDLPGDANGDNVYQVTLQASDGKANSTLAVSITVTNDRENIRVQRVGRMEGAVAIASFEEPNFDGRANLLIAYANGTISQLGSYDGRGTGYLRITSSSSDFALLGLTRARITKTGERLATYVLAREGTQVWVLCSGCRNNGSISGRIADIADGSPVSIGTGPDGMAYVAVGDLGGTHAQTNQDFTRNGKLYRISMNPDPYGGASLPEDLFLKDEVGFGLRAPAGITALPNGRLLISDRGETAFDEISVTSTLSGLNFGWPFFEGTRERNAGGAALTGLVSPLLAIPLGTDKRQSRGIVGGVAYTGPLVGIRDQYVFADKDGRIWSIPLSKLGSGPLDPKMLELRDEDFTPDEGKIDHPIAIATDGSGNVYILDADGDLFVVGYADAGSVEIYTTQPNPNP